MKKIAEKEEKLAKSNNATEKHQLQSEIKKEKRRVAEEVNVKLVAEIAILPKISMEADFKNPNCCLIS